MNDRSVTAGHAPSGFHHSPLFPQLLALLIKQGRVKEAWELELRREKRIDWEIEQAKGPSA